MMHNPRFTRKTRKRSHHRNINIAPSRSHAASSCSCSCSWSSLLWMLAVIAASPPSSSSSSSSASQSKASWAVRGQEESSSSQLRAVSATASSPTMVRGGRGSGRGSNHNHNHDGSVNVSGRAFIRQSREQQNNIDDDDNDDDDDKNDRHKSNQQETGQHHVDNTVDDNLTLVHHLLDKQQARRRTASKENPHDYFLAWCQNSLGIDVSLIEIDHFGYPDYLRAMEDRIDIFCDDCNEDHHGDDSNYGFDRNSDGIENKNEINSRQNGSDNDENGGSDDSFGKHKIEYLDDGDQYLSASTEYPPVSVRGLKASRDIAIGEVVLSVPHEALWTVHNAIDASGDPNLVEAMGPSARSKHGWESPGMDEIPMLAITLLYHMDQDRATASEIANGNENTNVDAADDPDRPDIDHKPYLSILELQTHRLEDTIPHLWPSRKLRRSATPSVRRVATMIRQDVVELYESIVLVLIEHHPSVFGDHRKALKANQNGNQNVNHANDGSDSKENGNRGGDETAPEPKIGNGNEEEGAIPDTNLNTNEDEDEYEYEWMFSLEKFHWAFALVNSRHWHLQIPDFPTPPLSEQDDGEEKVGEDDVNNVHTADMEKLDEADEFDVDNDDVVIHEVDLDLEVEEEMESQLLPSGPERHNDFDSESESKSKSVLESDSNTNEDPVDFNSHRVDKDEDADIDAGADADADADNHISFADQEGPPAATPTDEWVVIQDQKLREEEEREMNGDEGHENENENDEKINGTPPEESSVPQESDEDEIENWPPGHSFLAPLADLLNFGPPCTRGIYNHETNAFEIIATCTFRKGQEITFWYTDACEDVFVANYGFTMPMMVQKCGDPNNRSGHPDGRGSDGRNSNNNNFDNNGSVVWQQQQQEQQQQYLEDELFHAYEELDRLDQRLDFLMNVLDDCHCGNQTELLEGAWSSSEQKTRRADEEGYHETKSNHKNKNMDGIETEVKDGADGSRGGGGGRGATTTTSTKTLPVSPSPPAREVRETTTKGSSNINDGGPEAQHAIRNRGGGSSSSSKNKNRNKNQRGGRGRGDGGRRAQARSSQQMHHHHHHNSMTRTRTRSRSHHGHSGSYELSSDLL